VEYARNPRKNDHAVDKVAAAIREFGFRVPIVANSDGTIVDGHLRFKAARKLGLDTVPVLLADDMSEAQIKAFRISVNKVAELAEWDDELLMLELSELQESEFDLSLIGFDDNELDTLLKALNDEPGELLGDEDEVPEAPAQPVTVRGDVWVLGNHRVMCGDSTNLTDVERLINQKKVTMAIGDPPYNVSYEYDKIKDEMSENDYGQFCSSYLNNALNFAEFAVITPGKNNEKYYTTRPDYLGYMVWNKKFSSSLGSFYKCLVTEPILAFGKKIKNRHYATDYFEVLTEREPGLRKLHTCPKPVELFCQLIEPMTEPKEIVYEAFGGSGTSVIACEKLSRICYAMEFSENYCDVIVKRWQSLTGKQATLESTGQTFAQVESERL
jgi:DNA modification methylase